MSKSVNLLPSGLPGHHRSVSLEKAKKPGMVITRIWQYFGKQKILFLLVILFLLLNTAASLYGSYLLRPIINNYIIPGRVQGLLQMVVLLMAIYLLGVIAAFFQSRLMIYVAQKTVNIIRADMFCKMQTLPIRFYDTHNHGELMSRFTNDLDNVSDALNDSVTQIISSLITVAGTFVLMLYISPMLSLVTTVVVFAMFWLAKLIIQKSNTYFTGQQAALGILNGYIEEIITGEKTVKVYCHEEEATDDFEKLNKGLLKKATKAQFYSGIMMPIMQNLNTINFALTAAAGGIMSIVTGLDIGGLAAFLQYSKQFSRPLNQISGEFSSFQTAMASAERIFEVMDQLPEKADEKQAVELANIKGEIHFNQVTFSYNPGKTILKNISLKALPGQKIAFVGSTGAGKSTIINLLPRFYDIQSGDISIDGTDIRMIKRKNLRQSLAMVLQDTHLFHGTVMENIRYGSLKATDQQVIAAAKLVSADSFIKRLPKGYLTILEDDGNNLSQGQRQLLNIARAAVADPRILILDEATSSIDTRTEIHIQIGIDRLMEGRTSFVVAHRLSTIINADKIIVLEQGEIIEQGSHAELLKQKGRYFELYTSQFD
ncbi:ATP-binding cassette subfamily B protein [Pedobacter cryoconitis]|uniref:ATP-binding cassette subfamily B protein n=1 Tax=Pedobacter cryoconitis TaxID=188932 RepID=A0A327S169_9SPHI|nr:ATP-binding cassette subfamily B protein [Pedobacter cryoconitis]